MIRFRRSVQLFFLLLFLFLLTIASVSGLSMAALDLFLLMDPSLVAVTAISGRVLLFGFIPAALVLLSGPLIGRVFCGYICPMGTTLDGTDALFGSAGKKSLFSSRLINIKYLVIVFLAGAALLGVSYIFFASPISLITRAYGLVIFPAVSFVSREALDLVRPLGDIIGWSALSFAQIRTIRFATQWFLLLFFAAVIAMVLFSPRFWCRYVCPSGALIALVSRAPLVRRRVSDRCTRCGKCARKCPMSAIDPETPEITRHSECIVCRTCEAVCPENAVSFGRMRNGDAQPAGSFSLKRRQLVSTGLIGAGTAIASLTGLTSVYGKTGEGQVKPPGLIRPPGAVPEMAFLARCVRCGECMAACPTNTLQPIWLQAGFPAIFSPAITPRRGFCDPQCHECGKVCPTGAIRSLVPPDRSWAKTGTARIIRQKCLAWEFQKSCMVCDEVCPYDAIAFLKTEDGKVAVPHVLEHKCAGCGYCEHFCPVQHEAAIVVTPMDALRIETGSYAAEAKQKGFQLRLKPKGQPAVPPTDLSDDHQGGAPGFDDP